MLKGKVTGLRAIEKEDLPQLMEWRNQPSFRKYFREFRELNSSKQELWFDRLVMNDPNTIMFSIIDIETSELLGACGLCYIDWQNRSADFSIYIGKDHLYIDNIYAIDAAKIMMKYAFEELNLHRLWSEIYDFDEAKKQFFQTLRFTLDGQFRQTHWTEGQWCDSLFFSLLVNDQLELR
jgi:RimJ/RimL family protein N-acetyltransferase